METTTIDYSKLSLSQIAMEIYKDWKKVYFGAVPYLQAMSCLQSVNDGYGCEDGKTQVMYFIGNANTWRGETAKAIKKELKKRCGMK